MCFFYYVKDSAKYSYIVTSFHCTFISDNTNVYSFCSYLFRYLQDLICLWQCSMVKAKNYLEFSPVLVFDFFWVSRILSKMLLFEERIKIVPLLWVKAQSDPWVFTWSTNSPSCLQYWGTFGPPSKFYLFFCIDLSITYVGDV